MRVVIAGFGVVEREAWCSGLVGSKAERDGDCENVGFWKVASELKTTVLYGWPTQLHFILGVYLYCTSALLKSDETGKCYRAFLISLLTAFLSSDSEFFLAVL